MTNDTTPAPIGALKTWWAMLEAHWELDGETPPDDAVVLHFMGSGASSTVTAWQMRAALASAAQQAPAPAAVAVPDVEFSRFLTDVMNMPTLRDCFKHNASASEYRGHMERIKRGCAKAQAKEGAIHE